MGTSRDTEAPIIAALKRVEAGRGVEDVGREYGVSKHAIYPWKAKYGGLDVNEAQGVKQLRGENARLKKLVADLSLKDMLQSVIRNNSPGLVERRVEVRRLVMKFSASERYASDLMEIGGADDTSLLQSARRHSTAQAVAEAGAREAAIRLPPDPYPARPRGRVVNHKRVQRIYRELGVSVKRTKRKRLMRVLHPRPTLTAPNQEEAVDFVSDVAASGQRLRMFCAVDGFTSECSR